jgi:hypothetical protein
MKGMGDQAISIPLDVLHGLLTDQGENGRPDFLPKSVDIIEVLPRPKQHDAWIPEDRQPRLYLRIKHKYCFRRPPGTPLCHEDYYDFLKRFEQIFLTDTHK